MAGSVNLVILVGRVGRDPEIRRTNSGDRIANISLATSESWRDKNSGEKQERTEWHKVVVFNDKLAGVIEQHVKKGSLISVTGQLQTRKWQDQSGNDRYTTEVVIQRFRGDLTFLDRAPSQDSGQGEPARQEQDGSYADDDPDSIPF